MRAARITGATHLTYRANDSPHPRRDQPAGVVGGDDLYRPAATPRDDGNTARKRLQIDDPKPFVRRGHRKKISATVRLGKHRVRDAPVNPDTLREVACRDHAAKPARVPRIGCVVSVDIKACPGKRCKGTDEAVDVFAWNKVAHKDDTTDSVAFTLGGVGSGRPVRAGRLTGRVTDGRPGGAPPPRPPPERQPLSGAERRLPPAPVEV